MTLHDTDELTCPRCGDVLEGDFGPTEPDVGSEVRIPFDCPTCEAPLEVVMESALPEGSGLDVWVEDRRTGDNGA